MVKSTADFWPAYRLANDTGFAPHRDGTRGVLHQFVAISTTPSASLMSSPTPHESVVQGVGLGGQAFQRGEVLSRHRDPHVHPIH